MAKLKMVVELEYDEEMMHTDGTDNGHKWFYDVLQTDRLELWSEEIGDWVGVVTVFELTAVEDGE